jgi:enoyl-CoA hydratase
MSIDLSFHDEIAVITIDRPEALNALTFALIKDIGAAIDEVGGSRARALVITGAGDKAFCAGADIKELEGRPLAEQLDGARLGQSVFARLDALPIASVAKVGGYAFGGGLELALACTFRLATPNARFGLPEIKLGLIPGYGGTQRLPRLIGASRALHLIMTGRTIRADEALGMGLVNGIVEGGGMEAALAFAREFSGHGLLSQRFAREAVQRGLAGTLEDGLRIEADLSTLAYRTEDAAEGMRAFVEKRSPEFHDR